MKILIVLMFALMMQTSYADHSHRSSHNHSHRYLHSHRHNTHQHSHLWAVIGNIAIRSIVSTQYDPISLEYQRGQLDRQRMEYQRAQQNAYRRGYNRW